MSAAPSETRSENEWAASATRTRLPQAAPTIALEAERATLTPAPMTVMRASSDSRVLVGGALASMLGTRALCTSRTGGAIAGDAREAEGVLARVVAVVAALEAADGLAPPRWPRPLVDQ